MTESAKTPDAKTPTLDIRQASRCTVPLSNMPAFHRSADRDKLQGLPYRDNYPCREIPVR